MFDGVHLVLEVELGELEGGVKTLGSAHQLRPTRLQESGGPVQQSTTVRQH